MIILLFLSLAPFAYEAHGNGAALIAEINLIIDRSLDNVSRLGRLGREKLQSSEGGYLVYETRLDGINKVLNTIQFHHFKKDTLVIDGNIENRTDWSGNGISLSNFRISGRNTLSLRIEMKLENKLRTEGIYTLIFEDGSEYSFTHEEVIRL